ncbi:MAG: DsbA family oxidoreductase [Xanthomonadales bacterium]|nr:DsbA family oxidoreductase [Xanthomonadales bacterium]
MTESTPLRIDFVSDVACPWCAIGLTSLQQALRELDGTVRAEIHLQPFELAPDMAFEGEDTGTRLMHKYGIDATQLEANRGTIRARGQALGLDLKLGDGNRSWNTFDAHRLLHWVGLSNLNLALQLKRSLFDTYFGSNDNLADHAVLLRLASSLGIDREAARAVLESDDHADQVRAQERHFQQAGIHSVPATIINGTWLLRGGQPPEAFVQALREIAETVATQPTH